MRRTGLILTAAATCLGLAACSSEEPTPIAEPAVSFPTTKSVASSTPSTTKKEDEDKDSTTTSKSTTTRKTTSARPANPVDRNSAAAPAPAPVGERIVKTECTWPKESEAKNGEEFQRFCDGNWAETSFPGEGDFVWKADGPRWVSIEAKAGADGQMCYNRDELKGAPEALLNSLPLCAVEEN
ncbi:hypothetical protein [Corynebacterium mayonis]|uniref:hypothetical protein n=1 Tax=Corynebacterium mayonis TaxID=3062461 RepID=UPI0031402AFC